MMICASARNRRLISSESFATIGFRLNLVPSVTALSVPFWNSRISPMVILPIRIREKAEAGQADGG